MMNAAALINRLWTRIRNFGTAQPLHWPDAARWRRSYNTVPGVYVNEENALTLAAVWCAVRAICEPLAAMPYHVFQSLGERDNRPVRDHPLDWLISKQPNPEMTAYDFWDVLLQWALTWGNGYAEIERNVRGEPAWLWPIEPWRVYLTRNAAGGLVYRVTNQNREYTELDAPDVYHLHGLGNGLTGYSVVGMARATIGLGLTLEQMGASFFGNGAQLGTVIQAPLGVNLARDTIDVMLAEFDRRYAGSRNAFKTAYLDKGMSVASRGVPPEDAQFLESRQFSVTEIARWFRVPPHMLYDLARSTYSNIENQSLEYVVHTLLPWARRIEMQTDIKLFGRQQRGNYYSRINLNGLARGDIKSRFEAYGIARQWGWFSANDVRALEDQSAIPGGDEYLAPLNMAPADLLREQIQANIDKTEGETAATTAPPPSAQPTAASADGADAGDTEDASASNRARVLEFARRMAARN